MSEIAGRCQDDAQKWAAQFVKTLREHPETADPHDEDFMVGWFANAIETAVDARRASLPSQKDAA